VHGQLVFFAGFLAATGAIERRVSECPLAYPSGNAPDKREVQGTPMLGTLMLGWSAGHRRYAHITALRGRPLLLAAVGRATHSSGQTTLYLTPLHGKADLLKSPTANIHAALQHVKTAAEQFKATDR